MIDMALDHKIRVVIGTMSYNYADAPFSAEGFNEIDQLYYLSDEDLRKELRNKPNNSFLGYAIAVHAYWRHDYAEAKRLFDTALLHDTRPVRATTRINEIIRSVADKKNIPVADVYGAVVSQHPLGIPDFDLFVDACHLNNRGNEILQQAFADTIIHAMKEAR
jgi:hypothetical protein